MEELARLVLLLFLAGIIISMVKAGSPSGGADWMRAKFLGQTKAAK